MRGTMIDMYRRPDKLLAAMDKVFSWSIGGAMAQCHMTGNPRVFIPLHRGADGFMSNKQFETFYWPGLKRLMLGLIDAGLTPCPFFEGAYNQRLEFLTDLPRGKIMGLFDQTDVFHAKKVIGDTLCIAGNMPIALLHVGTKEEIRAYTRRLIEEVGQGGGFIMSCGGVMDEADPERVMAWRDATREFGSYR
jgi:uroporphyrinogen-III decarboxylase